MVEVTGTYCLDDLRRFHYFTFWRRGWWLYILVAIPLVILAARAPGADSSTRFANALPFVALLFIYTIFYAVAPDLGAWNQLRKQAHLRDPVSYAFTPETIMIRGTGSSSTIAWSILFKVRETKSLFILYMGPNSGEVVPKRFFQSPDEMERWRALVGASMGAKPIEEPGFVGRWC
jgi:hypothetical protein